jgi:glycine cleavage system T protein (aminomethyltransferase)
VTSADSLKRTPLADLHRELGAKMVPFAGYEMPVQYPTGIIAEHQHTREHAGLFDVSHMGQIRLEADNFNAAAAALERLVPGDVAGLQPGRMRYTQLTNPAGGILDDLMVARRGEHLFLVVNAGQKEADATHLRDDLVGRARIETLFDRALLALQGPSAAAVLMRFDSRAAEMGFMTVADLSIQGVPCIVSRSGYTGEDGFEISAAATDAVKVARLLLDHPEVKPIGLGARDSLRLEAGLCLYGHDIDETTTPIEAGLAWSIGKRRRTEGGFPGAASILEQIAQGPTRKRVGIRPAGRAPARENTEITDLKGGLIGKVTSGGFGPTLGGPICMGYVHSSHAAPGIEVQLVVRGSPRSARVAELPFVPHRYKQN